MLFFVVAFLLLWWQVPYHPELNCYVERYNKTYKQECVEIFRPTALDEIRTVTAAFGYHYNQERPHQGCSCGN